MPYLMPKSGLGKKQAPLSENQDKHLCRNDPQEHRERIDRSIAECRSVVSCGLVGISQCRRIYAQYRNDRDQEAAENVEKSVAFDDSADEVASRLLEDNSTPADRAAHIDLADWLIQYLEDKNA